MPKNLSSKKDTFCIDKFGYSTYLSITVNQRRQKMEHQPLTYGHWQATPGTLARRETEVTLHVTMGETDKIIAKKLGLSPATITKTLQRVMYKLNTYTRAQTIGEAIRTGIVSTLLVIFALQNLTSLDNMMRTPRSRPNYSTRLNSGRNNSKNGDS